MNQKKLFIQNLKDRTKRFAVEIILFCNSLRLCKASAVITYQLVRAATSVGANYRAACRARSKAEFFSKICIVVEESDESVYWLELIEASSLSSFTIELKKLLKEAQEITKIMAKAKDSTYKTNKCH